ncbi:MAG: hypothetical protein LBW85_05340 [Deltaproteobacteria bacterium]|jgi:hypothetical protein|nr:hypothetical protein [Deltaproteobacteria bacterium]
MPSPDKAKALAATLAIVAALAVSATLAVRAKMRDEGARSVAAALDASFGARGWSAGSFSFDSASRAFTATDVALTLPDWALAGSGAPGEAGLKALGPLKAARLTVRAPALPMSLNSLAESGFVPEGSPERLFGSLELEGLELPLERSGERFTARASSLALREALLDPSPPRGPAAVPAALWGLRLESAEITGLAVFRDGDAASPLSADSVYLAEPGLLRLPARGIAGLLAAKSALFTGISASRGGLRIAAASLAVAGPLYGAPASQAFARSESATGLELTCLIPPAAGGAAAPRPGAAGDGGRRNPDTAGISGSLAASADGAGNPAEPRPERELKLSASSLAVEGGSLWRVFDDLGVFLSALPPGDPARAVPLSLPLIPPFTLESLQAEGLRLEAGGEAVLVLDAASLTGPVAKGAPAPVQKTELAGLAFPAWRPPPTGARAVGPPELSRRGPGPFRVFLETRYSDRLGSLIVPSFSLEAEGLFSVSGSMVLLGAGPEALAELARCPLARPQEIWGRPGLAKTALGALSLEYSDLGLARLLVSDAARRRRGGAGAAAEASDSGGATGGPADGAVGEFASSFGILALSWADPYLLNAPEIVRELQAFILDPAGFSLSVASEEPLPLGAVDTELLEQALKVDDARDHRAIAEFLFPLKVTAHASGRPPVAFRWREVPQAFASPINPTQSRHDGLGGLD